VGIRKLRNELQGPTTVALAGTAGPNIEIQRDQKPIRRKVMSQAPLLKKQLTIDIAKEVFDALRINRKLNPQEFNALINKIKTTH
jgi:hypothetical protein